MKYLPASILLLAACAAPPPVPADPAAIVPHRIRVDDAVLEDLRARLGRTRWPDQIPGSGWAYGPDVAYLRGLLDYWRDGFDWRAQERRLNAFDQFTTEVDGVRIHFIHHRSKHANALPLVLVHGWPGSIAEFSRVLGPLVDPVAHGGRTGDAFHVIVPSLPGFGFSEKPREPGWTPDRMADAIRVVMDRLGYERYGCQGGDWGAPIAVRLAYGDPRVVGVHVNYVTMGSMPKIADPWEGVPAAERERHERRAKELADHYGYSAIQSTRPLALAYGLNDSPAGLAAWVVDKFWAWSDHGGNLDSKFPKDELLTNLMLYWATESMPSATRIYYEYRHPVPAPAGATARRAGRKEPPPMGVALFPKELNVPPRSWVERNAKIVHWTEMPRGGHFAALEEPELFVADVRAFFSKVR